jgi:hypothetical protein
MLIGRIWRPFLEIVAALGGIASILIWRGIRPEDLREGPTHWAWLLVAITLLGLSLWSSGYGLYRILRAQRKLVIHSAVYGTGSEADVDVTDILRNSDRDALVVDVENKSFGSDDPAYGIPKQLTVEYSYGNHVRKTIVWPEHSRLILPEDPEIERLREKIERLAKENEELKFTVGIVSKQNTF